MSTSQIRLRLDGILEFMQPYWEFVNCHMVNYFTHKHWQNYIPLDIREEVSNPQKVRQCIESQFWRKGNPEAKLKFPALAQFIKSCEEHRLSNFNEILVTIEGLQKILGVKQKTESGLSIKEFMNDKKRHEVELTAKLINDLIVAYPYDKAKDEFYVIDAGDGKGYLSSRLALEYGHKVLGVDASEMNTENALARSRKLERAWNGLVKRAELIERGITPPRRGKKKSTLNNNILKDHNTNYYTTARFIDSSLNMTNLLQENFPQITKIPIICLTGLHTCGNLATTCLRAFNKQSNCKILCNIGCCYHLLKEKFTTIEMEHSSSNQQSMEACFPISNFLCRKEVKMGRNARMLAAQCIERTLTTRELPNISLFYRALLEVFIQNELPDRYREQDSVQVGRLRKFQNFPDYVTQCAKKTNLIELHKLNFETINAIESTYIDERAYLELFYLLRMLFAPILETLILLDRLLYLRELNYKRSYLVSVFDAVISPRHYAIIALKSS